MDGEAGQAGVLGQATVGSAVQQDDAGLRGVVAKDGGDADGVLAGGGRQKNRVVEFQLAAAGEIFGDDGEVSFLTPLIRIARKGGEKG